MKQLNQKMPYWLKGGLAGSLLITSSLGIWAQSPADPHKVLRYVFPVAETGFDPAAVHDLYSAHVNASILRLYLATIIWQRLPSWCHVPQSLYLKSVPMV